MSIPPNPPHDFRAMFAVESERLLTILRSLSEADWQRATPCPGWDVRALATHLLGGDFYVVSSLRDGFHGTQPPAELGDEGFISWLDDLQAQWVLAAKRISPSLVTELLEWVSSRFQKSLDAHDPSEVTASVSWASSEPVPVWLDHARELTEKWIHRQQILQAIGQPSDLRADLALPVLQSLRWAYPYRLNQIKRPAGSRVEIVIDDEHLGQRWSLLSNGEKWTFDDVGNPQAVASEIRPLPIASLTTSAESMWRLLTNNYDSVSDLPVNATGDTEIVNTLMNTRAIIGHPK